MSLSVDIKKKLGGFSLDTSFETDGDILGILGASGCGKSMTLKCIAGIEKPDSGRIILNDVTLFDSERKINLSPQQRRVGYLFQSYSLFPNMTVRQNILCGLHREKDKTAKMRELEKVLALMQLEGLEERRPAQLSGGEQQRTALARILVNNPDLLMLDEPFSALDSHLRGKLQLQTQMILRQFGKTTLMVTHSRNEAYRLCDKLALMDAGKLLAQKGTKELFSDPGSRQAALLTGCKNVVDAKKSGDYEVDVPNWGVRFVAAQPVRDDLCAIGIRAHYFDPNIKQNSFPVTVASETEDPFEYVIQFRYNNQVGGSPDICRRVPKGSKTDQPDTKLGVDPANILLLYNA